VIRKTPEAYAKAGWDVDSVVARDTSKKGNYFYEPVFDPDGVNVLRIKMPLEKLRNFFENHFLNTLVSKLSGYLTILRLAGLASGKIKQNSYDLIYGYEVHGVLAVNLLKLLGKLKEKKIISRFQGVFYINPILKSKNYLKMILNWDHLLALKLGSDLSIMTNDGTQGDRVFQQIKSKNLKNYRFWVNGVDKISVSNSEISSLQTNLNLTKKSVFITISRLEKIKGIDRSLKALSILKNDLGFEDFHFLVVGEGSDRERLQQLTKDYKLTDQVLFTGSVSNEQVKVYLAVSDIFFSTFNSSNVGNPLLEAIRANKLIFTLNNGDTGQWIEHKKNGFIYDIHEEMYNKMADDILSLIQDEQMKNRIAENLKTTEKDKLWTWKERLDAEVTEVEKLIDLPRN